MISGKYNKEYKMARVICYINSRPRRVNLKEKGGRYEWVLEKQLNKNDNRYIINQNK